MKHIDEENSKEGPMSKILLVAVIITALASIACSEESDVWSPGSPSGYSRENSTTNQNNDNRPNREGTVISDDSTASIR